MTREEQEIAEDLGIIGAGIHPFRGSARIRAYRACRCRGPRPARLLADGRVSWPEIVFARLGQRHGGQRGHLGSMLVLTPGFRSSTQERLRDGSSRR